MESSKETVVPTIGREAGPVGRSIRLGAGLLATAGVVSGLAADDVTLAEAIRIPVAFALATLFYVVIHRTLGERVLSRGGPWIGAFIVLAPIGAMFFFDVGSEGVQEGLLLYVGISLIVTAVTGYGGCEVMGIPSVLFRRRYVLYCPWNAVDTVERPMTPAVDRGVVRAISAALAFLVVAYFVLVDPLLSELGVNSPVDRRWALLLMIPGILLGITAAQDWRRARDRFEVWNNALGGVVLVILAAVFSGLASSDVVWGTIMLTGAALALVKLVVSGGRRPAG